MGHLFSRKAEHSGLLLTAALGRVRKGGGEGQDTWKMTSEGLSTAGLPQAADNADFRI